MKKIRIEILLFIAVSIIVGFISGILGYIVVGSGGGLPLLGQVDFGHINWDKQIIIEQPRSVVVEQDFQLKQVENDLLPMLTDIYFWKKTANNLNQVYLSSEVLGGGIMLTSDGWMLTTDQALTLDPDKYRAFGYQYKEFEVEKFVTDPQTGIVFAKVTANNSPVMRIGDPNSIHVGQTLVLVSRQSGIKLTNVRRYGYNFQSAGDIVLSSEDSKRELLLDSDLKNELDGSILANLKGEVLGIIRSGNVVLVDQFKVIINQVLNNQEIKRPILGIKYIDLSQVDGLSYLGDKGALVTSAPLRTSPAFSKILNGDILLKIDDIEINSHNSLHKLINSYNPGDQLEFLIQRDNANIIVDIVLK